MVRSEGSFCREIISLGGGGGGVCEARLMASSSKEWGRAATERLDYFGWLCRAANESAAGCRGQRELLGGGGLWPVAAAALRWLQGTVECARGRAAGGQQAMALCRFPMQMMASRAADGAQLSVHVCLSTTLCLLRYGAVAVLSTARPDPAVCVLFCLAVPPQAINTAHRGNGPHPASR